MEAIFIYTDNCKDCARMRKLLADQLPQEVSLGEFNFNREQQKTIDVSVANEVSDIPAFVFNGKVVQGKQFDSNEVIEVIKEWRHGSTT